VSIHSDKDVEYDNWRDERTKLWAHIERLSAQVTTQSNAMRGIYTEGYAAGYAARDKLCLVNCGDGGKPVET